MSKIEGESFLNAYEFGNESSYNDVTNDISNKNI